MRCAKPESLGSIPRTTPEEERAKVAGTQISEQYSFTFLNKTEHLTTTQDENEYFLHFQLYVAKRVLVIG